MTKSRTKQSTIGLAALLLAGVTMTASGRDFMRRPSLYADALHGNLSLRELFGDPDNHDYIVVNGDTIRFDFSVDMRAQPLTERDYIEVARELGVEVAAIKAVVEIETGRTYRGFNEDKTPIVSFNIKVFDTMTRRHKVRLADYTQSHPLVFAGLDVERFGSPQAAEHARLREAMSIDSVCAIEGTFWGMFQIGGFNWRRCAAASPFEFMELMSRSERDQLDLFAAFIANSGLLKYLREKNWTAFARGYNGPTYAANAYHTRLAASYKKYSVNES